jgi:hypothetical protein
MYAYAAIITRPTMPRKRAVYAYLYCHGESAKEALQNALDELECERPFGFVAEDLGRIDARPAEWRPDLRIRKVLNITPGLLDFSEPLSDARLRNLLLKHAAQLARAPFRERRQGSEQRHDNEADGCISE